MPPATSSAARSSAATAPMTMVAGAATSIAASASRRPRSTRCAAVPARSTTATGVSGGRPPAMRRTAMPARSATPMRMTTVPPTWATASQSVASSSPGRRCPVTMVTAAASPRCVTGTPAKAGAATAELMPGTTSNATPASCNPSASSPPRPKTYGSPPFRRTTQPCRRPRSTRRAVISSWGTGRPGRLPTSISSAPGGTSASTASSTSASWTTTSAWANSRAAFSVSRSGSPGPAPTRCTVTGAVRIRSCRTRPTGRRGRPHPRRRPWCRASSPPRRSPGRRAG